MRVVAVSTWFPTAKAPSSGAFVVKDLCAIRDAGNDVSLVHLVPPHQDDGTRHVIHEGIRVWRVPFNPMNPLDIILAADQLTHAFDDADVIHSMAVSSLGPLAVLKMRGLIATPWVHTEHWSGLTNPETLTPLLRVSRPVVGQALRFPDVVTAVCDYLAAPIREYRRGKPVEIVPCIVPGADQLEDIPPLGEGDALRLVTVGGLIERKDPMMALDIVTELLGRGVKTTMVFVGDGPLRPEIERRAASGPLAGSVQLTGNLSRSGVLQELNASHLFIGPTRGDNFFVSCAEAIAQGRPVVVSDRGGQGEYVKPIAGRVLRSPTVSDYADAVLEVVGKASATDIAASLGTAFHSASVGAGYSSVYETVRR